MKNYLLVPLKVLSCLYPVELYIDMEQANILAGMKARSLVKDVTTHTAWPCSLDDFNNALVKTIHNPEAEDQLFEVVRVDKSVTLSSPFPDPKAAATYEEYYIKKYNFHISDIAQPALVVRPLGLGDSRLRLLVSRFKDHEGEDLKKKDQLRDIKLFPALCRLYPVGARLWKLVRCLPSVLWRVECIALVDTLRSTITREASIGCSDQSTLVLTQTNLRGYEDYGYGVLATQQISFGEDKEPQVKLLSNPDFTDFLLRGPDNALLLQALTPKGAKDSINLERLETLGDSFLKLSTTVFLFCDRPIDHEGKLTTSRSRRVGNLNLFLLAKQEGKEITKMLFSTAFEPRQMWIPPCFTFKEKSPQPAATDGDNVTQLTEKDRHYNYHKATDKGVADCIESLIGSYLVAGGIEAALRFMKWMGIKLQHHQNSIQLPAALGSDDQAEDMESGEIATSSSNSSYSTPPTSKRPRMTKADSLFLFNSSSVFVDHFGSPHYLELNHRQDLEVEKLLHICSGTSVGHSLKWEFKDHSLLLQALTHASYTRNRVTDCYQRLEFLGDAVLDYLVTCHIYSTFPKYSPGDISSMRSALVNNVTFAELSVKLRLHKALLYNSPSLFKQIEDYISILERDPVSDKPLLDSAELYCHSEEASQSIVSTPVHMYISQVCLWFAMLSLTSAFTFNYAGC